MPPALKAEPAALDAQARGRISLQGSVESGLKIKINRPIAEGEPLALFQDIDVQARSITESPEQGQLMHIQFKARSSDDNKMTAQVVESKPPYHQPMHERIDLSKDWQTYDLYTAITSDAYRFKLQLGREQQPGEIEIKDLKIARAEKAAPGDLQAGINANDVSDEAIKERIDRYRKANLTITIQDKDGKPRPGQVRVEQLTSRFLFGGDLNQLDDKNIPLPENGTADLARFKSEHILSPQEKEQYKGAIVDYGNNFVTIPIYWSQNEAKSGHFDRQKIDDSIKWAKEHGMQVKLTPLVWTNTYPAWAGKTSDQAKVQIHRHIDDIVKMYGDKVDFIEFNELNSFEQMRRQKREPAPEGAAGKVIKDKNGQSETELVQNGLSDWLRRAGPVSVFETTRQWAVEALSRLPGSHARLIENEYDIDRKTLSADKQWQHDGKQPDVYGVQMHMFNGYDSKLEIWQTLQNLDQFGKPVYISETTVPSKDGSKDQASELKAVYDLALSDPNVKGVSLWDMTDKNAWQNGTGGPLDENMRRKSWFNLLRSNYWTDERLVLPQSGTASMRGFKGDYRITLLDDRNEPIKDGHGKTVSTTVALDESDAKVNLRLP